MSYPTMHENMESKKHGTIHKTMDRYSDQAICGQIWDRFDYKRTSEEVTCKLCLRIIKSDEAWKKDERRKKLNIQVIESFKTSDGKVFNLEESAVVHEENLDQRKTEAKFAQFVREEIFGNPDAKTEDGILEDIHNKLEWVFSDEEYNLEGLSEILWHLFDGFEIVVAKALSKFRELKTK